MTETTPPTSRNAPCPCGSGRRYRDCHGALDAGAQASAPADSERLLAEAEAALDTGDVTSALARIDEAIAARPEHAPLHLLRARALVSALRPAEAESAARRALALTPDDPAAWTLLGHALAAGVSGAAAGDGTSAGSGKLAAAEEAWRTALSIDASDAEAMFCLGNAAYERGAFTEAIGIYRQALRHHPEDALLLHNLALSLERSGDAEAAGHAYVQALAAQDPPAEAHANFARLLQRRGDYSAAAEQFRIYVTQAGEVPTDIWWALALCQHRQGDLPGAEQTYRKALLESPDSADIKYGLAAVLVELGEGGEAVRMLTELRATDRSKHVLHALVCARQLVCDWTDWDATQDDLRARIGRGDDEPADTLIPLSSLALPLSPAQLLMVARRHALAWNDSARTPHTLPAVSAGRRLRIGYVSSDFRAHPIPYLLTELWERHDRDRFEVFAYSIGRPDDSALRRRIERAFEHFIDAGSEPVDATLSRIRDDGIDILIDLNGYTSGSRMELFAARAAPIQMHWLGFLGTLGAPWFDYIVTDRFVTPPPMQPHFTERFLYVPDGYTPSDTRRAIEAPPQSRAALGLPESAIVFCCFNNAYKIVPPVFDAWMRILGAVDGSVMWLSPATKATCANLQREAERRGIDADRLVFAPRAELPVYLARLQLADLFLDTWPYNAGATANDALLVGLPILTRAGDTMASRVAASQLHTLGVPELVTYDLAEYERRAIELARAPDRLAALKEKLREQRKVSPLFDMARYARGFESALVAACDEHRRTRG